MLVLGNPWGFLRLTGDGLTGGQYGPTTAQFGVGGTHPNPLLVHVDPGDEANGTQFVSVFAAQPSSGDFRNYWDGSATLIGAADGVYPIPFDLYTWTPGVGAAVVDRGPETYTVTVGAGGIEGVGDIPSEEAFGLPSLQAVISPASIDSEETFGALTLSAVIDLQGIASEEAFGQPLIDSADGTIYAAGIPSAEAFGLPSLAAVVSLTGIASTADVGAPSVRAQLIAAGIVPADAYGQPELHAQIDLAGIASEEAFGEPIVGDIPPHPIECEGIPSGEAFGRPTIGVANAKTGGRKKRKGNPFLRFRPPEEDREEEPQLPPAPVVAKARPAPKASGLLLGLIDRAITPPPAPPEPQAAQPVAIVASPAPKPKPALAPTPVDPTVARLDAIETAFVDRIAALETRIEDLLDTLSLTLQERLPPPPPPPKAAGLAIEEEPDLDPLIKPVLQASAEPEPNAAPSRRDIAKENKRRARALAKALLLDR